ncbi:hypothetical protein TPA0910_64990 [Streptomyces hygroscopicus subsp. sporocinereus]|uniref:Uncharacterized protein n=1 Tax=Streptomyces hygroscopicus TaxID=1912 RepID=A0ABQ3U8Z4_STRHY|nr:hypothetical protein TPA0910_64990 [Streptomyces hygroscopicus]
MADETAATPEPGRRSERTRAAVLAVARGRKPVPGKAPDPETRSGNPLRQGRALRPTSCPTAAPVLRQSLVSRGSLP